jgi:hypothetical protein
MSSLNTDRFNIQFPDGADLVEEEHLETPDPFAVWRLLGPRSLFWTLSLHRPAITASLAVNQAFGNVLSQYRQRPGFTSIYDVQVGVPTGIRMTTRVVFRDSVNEPLRVDVVAMDIAPGEVLLLQLAVAEWETVDAEWMSDALETLELR